MSQSPQSPADAIREVVEATEFSITGIQLFTQVDLPELQVHMVEPMLAASNRDLTVLASLMAFASSLLVELAHARGQTTDVIVGEYLERIRTRAATQIMEEEEQL